MIIFLPP